MKDETLENYLKTIYQIQQKKGCVYACNVAEERNVSKPSVSRCVHILTEEGYLYGSALMSRKHSRMLKNSNMMSVLRASVR